MAFVAIIVLITVLLGGIAMAGSMKADEDESQVKIEDEETKEEETVDEEETEPEEEEEDEEPSPTKKLAATSTTAPTKAADPTASPTPEEKKFNYNFLGDVIEDKNCSGSRDSGETTMSSITINLFKSDGSAFTSVKTDGSGHYSYASSLKEGESISLKGEPVVPSTHIIKPGTTYNTIEFKQGNNSGGQNFFMVPKDNEAQCSA